KLNHFLNGTLGDAIGDVGAQSVARGSVPFVGENGAEAGPLESKREAAAPGEKLKYGGPFAGRRRFEKLMPIVLTVGLGVEWIEPVPPVAGAFEGQHVAGSYLVIFEKRTH